MQKTNDAFDSEVAVPVIVIGAVFTTLGIVIRFLFALSLPMVENDSIIIFQAAREILHGNAISMVHTLPAVLLAVIWRFTGESLVAAAIPNFLSGLGCILLVYQMARDKEGTSGGILAALIASSLPLTVLFDSIAKPYSLMSFLILSGVFLFGRACRAKGIALFVLSLFSGFLLAGAFACHTFAAFAAFPLLVFFILGLAFKKYRSLALPSAISSLAFGVIFLLLVLWRFPVFGWSIFNDYVTDWRFNIATAVWSGRFEGLTNLFALGPFVLIPGLLLFILKKAKRGFWIEGLFLGAVIFLNLLTYGLNPVNHFPRVLMPSMAPLALFAGIGLVQALKSQRTYWYFALAVMLIGAFLLIAETIGGHGLLFNMANQASASVFILLVSALIIPSVLLYRFTAQRKISDLWKIVSISLLGIASIAFGSLHAHASLNRQLTYYQSRVQATSACRCNSGIIGGGDIVHLLFGGRNNYSWLTDLPEGKLESVLTKGLVTTLDEMSVTCVVVALGDPEGEEAMIRDFAKTRGLASDSIDEIYGELKGYPNVSVLFRGEKFITYALPLHQTTDFDLDKKMKRYSPAFRLPIWFAPR